MQVFMYPISLHDMISWKPPPKFETQSYSSALCGGYVGVCGWRSWRWQW